MKKNQKIASFSLAALAVAFTSQLSAQTTNEPVSTPIVGFSTATAAANGGSGIRYSLVAANLLNQPVFSGSISSNLVVEGSPFTSGQFNSGSVFAKYYVEITSGTNAGSYADIVSNTTNSLTVVDQLSFQAALGSGASVKIRKHRTLPEIFGGASGSISATDVVINKGTSASGADNIILRDDGVSKTYYYSSSSLRPGWRDQGGNSASDRPIYPTQGIMIARKINSAANITVTGEVNQNVTIYDLPAGLNLVTIPIPANVTLPQLFGGSSGTIGATDVKIAKGSSASGADNVLVAKANGTYDTYYYSSSSLRPGWRDSSGGAASTKILDGAVAFFIKKLSTGTMTSPSLVTN